MANDLNKTLIIGRMTRDIEITKPGNTSVGKFSIACNRKFKDIEEVSYFNCIAWGKTAEILQQHTKKGQQLGIEGRLRQNRWEDAQTGQKRDRVEIVVESFQFLGGKKDE
jgi:single-strand DNA-binding protein